MDRERQEALQWFVNFANMNLDALRPGDKAKLLVEVEEHLLPPNKLEVLPEEFPLSGLLRSDTKEYTKKYLKEHLGKMDWISKTPFNKDSPEFWDMIVRLKEVVRKGLSDLLSLRGNPTAVGVKRAVIWDEPSLISFKWVPDKFVFSFVPLTASQNDYILIKLYRLFDGLHGFALQKCPGCKNYFLNPSLRKKNFCSPRCMWKINAEKRRKADPEGYKAKQRKIMREKYEATKKAQLGPNIKVGRKKS